MEGQEQVDHQCETKGDDVSRRSTASSPGDEASLYDERTAVKGEQHKYVSDNGE